jgi:hypothetical protein
LAAVRVINDTTGTGIEQSQFEGFDRAKFNQIVVPVSRHSEPVLFEPMLTLSNMCDYHLKLKKERARGAFSRMLQCFVRLTTLSLLTNQATLQRVRAMTCPRVMYQRLE